MKSNNQVGIKGDGRNQVAGDMVGIELQRLEIGIIEQQRGFAIIQQCCFTGCSGNRPSGLDQQLALE